MVVLVSCFKVQTISQKRNIRVCRRDNVYVTVYTDAHEYCWHADLTKVNISAAT